MKAAGASYRSLAAFVSLLVAAGIISSLYLRPVSQQIGADAVVIGNVPSTARIGNGSVVIGATDARGNTILTQPMAIGHGAQAGPGSIAIGAGAGAGAVRPAP